MIKLPSQLSMRKNFIIFVFFLFLSLMNFWGSLHNPFIIDDSEHYLNSKKRNNAFLIYDLIPNQTFAANPGMQGYQNNWGYYRPFMHVFFRFQSQILKDNPVHYHLMCIVFFAWACFSVFQLLSFIIRNELAAFLGATLYLLHPFQGLCVNYKTAVTLSIQIILLNTSFLIVAKAKDVFDRKEALKYLGALLCYMLALLIHELAFVFPAILFLYWIILDDKSTMNFLYKWLGFIFVSAIYLWLRFNYENFIGGVYLHYKLTLKEFLAAYTREISWVIRRLIYPKDIFLQSATWVTKGIANQWVLIFYMYVICFVSLLWIFYRRNKVLFFLLGVFVSGFILSMPPSKNMLSDGIIYFEPHWIFYTNIGLFGILGYLFSSILKYNNKLGVFVSMFFAAYLFYFSFVENHLYHNSDVFFQRWSNDSPSLDLPQLSVCYERISSRQLDSAIDCLMPLTHRLRKANAYYGLGQVYFIKNDYKKAKENFQRAKDAGVVEMSLINLSLISDKEGDIDQAIKYLDEGLLYDKFSLDLYLSKVALYAEQKKWKEAKEVLDQVYSIYPYNENILFSRISVLYQMKDYTKARRLAAQAIPHLTRIDNLVRLTIVLLKNHEEELSKIAYQKAFEIDPEMTKDVSKNAFICPLRDKK